ncbi:MAG: DEAD/DEAH box helicase family protein [Isosphaeraceae bacterium]
MTPEESARQDIDRQLAQCGWVVQNRNEMNLSAARGIAVREFPMLTGEADYLLYAGGKAIGVVEAKPKGHPLIGVETQSAKYAGALPPEIPAHSSPLPFSYESTGAVTQFTNLLEPDARSREVFTFHRPEELLRLAQLDAQVRGKLQALPPLDNSKLWSVQRRAIENLEQSLAKNKPRSLIQMATGSGKTFTAVNATYRLIKFGGAKRVLFLVDRSNLGRQTYREFQQFVSPVNSYLAFPLAPLAEQGEIVQEVERRFSILDEIEAQVDANLKRAARLRQGILKRAFEGRLVPQDPTDEPAEKLLERIRERHNAASTATNRSPRTPRRGRRPKGGSTPLMFL